MQPADPVAISDQSPAVRALAQGYRWLKFAEPLESQYREQHRANAHRVVRVSVVVALSTTIGFALIDRLLLNVTSGAPDLARYGLQFPVLVVCLLATFRQFYLRWYESAIRIGAPLFGFGTLLMTCYALPEHMPLVGARLLLLNFFCYFMLGLRMRVALACNATVFFALVAVCLAGLLPPEVGWYLAFGLLCANVIGSVGAYALEYANRTAFLDRLSLEEVAARDGLTRLLNRQTFELRAGAVWHSATGLQQSIAVLMIDVDYFKRYNDHYGHPAGDKCLRQVAATVRAAIDPRHDDLVARYGGEELIALLIGRNACEVEHTANAIVQNVAGLTIGHAASVVADRVTVSVGATLYVPASSTASVVFNNVASVADKALYAAKRQGRNRYVVLQAHVDDAAPTWSEGSARPEARALAAADELAAVARGA
jgi:diguanylate cyclase (GGDEF)-like protein